MVNVTSKVELSGNFFRKDPGKTFYANLGDMLDRLAEELEGQARQQIESHEGAMPYWTGWTRDHTVGYREARKHWATWAAVGVRATGLDKAQAIRTYAAAATIERRFHPFRNVKSGVYRARALLRADLTKGLE